MPKIRGDFYNDELLSNLSDIPSEQLYAAVDLGSNSFQLTVARLVNDDLLPVNRIKQRVKIAAGLDDNNVLDEAAIARGLDALALFAEQLAHLQINQIRTVATFTLREAVNSKVFIKRAKKIYPYRIEIISGHEEARLIYQGVAHYHFSSEPRLIFDIGGGSTEFILGQGFETLKLHSLAMGCVSFTQYFGAGELTEANYKKALKKAKLCLKDIEQRFSQHNWDIVIGTSGTVKAILELANNLEQNTSGLIKLSSLQTIKKLMFEAEHIDKLKLPSITPERLTILPAGVAIVEAIMTFLGIEQFEYCAASLREGVLCEISDKLEHHDIRERTTMDLVRHYHVDIAQSKRLENTVNFLVSEVEKNWKISESQRSILSNAAMLHEVGLVINSRGIQKHSAYILQNADLPGFNIEQQTLLATLVRCFRNKVKLDMLPEFEETSTRQCCRLICLLRLAVILNHQRRDMHLGVTAVISKKNRLELHFKPEWQDTHVLIADALEQECLDIAALNIELIIQHEK